MFADIVLNTNPVLAALPDEDDIQVSSLFIDPGAGFFNMKQQLLQNQANTAVLLSEEEDKLEFDPELDFLSEFTDEQDKQMMLDFIHLRPSGDQLVGGVFQTPRRHRALTFIDEPLSPDLDHSLVEQLESSPFEVEYDQC